MHRFPATNGETRRRPATPTSVSAGAPRQAGASALAPEVVLRAQAGDAEAFRVIFEAHLAPVRRFCRDLLRDPAAADEAAQETFVRANGRLGSLREPALLSSWLLGIARLVTLEQRRRGLWLVPLSWLGARRAGDQEAAEEPADDGDTAATPEQALLGKEAERALEGALATLSVDRRAALLLRLDHGLGYPEIGAALGWPLSKVKNELHRARLQLRERLAGFLAEGR